MTEKREHEIDTDEKPTSNKKYNMATTGAHIMSDADDLTSSAQTLIDEMDEKRKQDGALIAG